MALWVSGALRHYCASVLLDVDHAGKLNRADEPTALAARPPARRPLHGADLSKRTCQRAVPDPAVYTVTPAQRAYAASLSLRRRSACMSARMVSWTIG
jgi:hypothetical protein